MTCDPVRIEQALHSLLDNAVNYSPTGGTITIQLERNDLEVRLSVADTGVGIAAEHLEHIFDRFYRVQQSDGQYSGSGLGLAMARTTFEAHGGRIWVDSPGIGLGATFYCTLPLASRLSSVAQPQTLRISKRRGYRAASIASYAHYWLAQTEPAFVYTGGGGRSTLDSLLAG